VVVEVLSTVNQLLLRQISKLLVFDLVVSFNSTNSREGPAAATTSLILDWSNSSNVSPVPMVRHILYNWTLHLFLLVSGRAVLRCSDDVEVLSEFFLGDVREFIDTLHVGSLGTGIVLNDLLQLLNKDASPGNITGHLGRDQV